MDIMEIVETEPNLPGLLSRLNARKRAEREVAERDVYALPPESFLALIQLEGEQHIARRKKGWRGFLWLLAALIALGVLAAAVTANWELLAMMIAGLVYSPYLLIFFVPFFVPSKARRSLVKILGEVDDLRFVGPALVLLAEHSKNSSLQPSIVAALNRLLPRFRADQTDMLDTKQMRSLLQRLTEPYRRPALSACILKALEQIGDEKALPYVEKIARKKRPRPNELGVVEAARECLPYLQARAEAAKQANTLLRASSAETASPETLLRPAYERADARPDELLRPNG